MLSRSALRPVPVATTPGIHRGAALERHCWPRILGALLLLDACMLLLAGVLAEQAGTRTAGLSPYALITTSSLGPHRDFYGSLLFLYVPLNLAMYLAMGAYRRRTLFRGTLEYEAIFSATGLATLLTEFASSLFAREYEATRAWLLFAWIVGAALVMGERFIARRVLRALHRREMLVQPAIIVGSGREGQILEWHVRRARQEGIRVLGYVDDGLPPGSEVAGGLAVLGGIDELPALIARHSVELVLVAPADLLPQDALRVLRYVLPTPAEVALAPDLFRTLTTDGQLLRVGGDPLLLMNKGRITGVDALLKGLLDCLGALVLLAVSLPLALLIACAICLTSPGPLLERYPTIGARGRHFHALKFRTTRRPEASSEHPVLLERRRRGLPVREYPELTRLGRFLRRYSLDELPQLLNVLAGQMSLVGPYKISLDQLGLYGERQLPLLSVRPGITGVCQVSGRGELTVEERALLDAEYVRTFSIWRDLQILAATVPAVLHGSGAY